MAGRPVYVYRLLIAYPCGSREPGWRPQAWTAAENARRSLSRRHRRALREREFSWPRERLFLSSSGAYGRARLLCWYGAQVTVLRSDEVTWLRAAGWEDWMDQDSMDTLPADTPDQWPEFDACGIPA